MWILFFLFHLATWSVAPGQPTPLLGNLCRHIGVEQDDVYWQKQPDQRAETNHPLHFTLWVTAGSAQLKQRSQNAVKRIADGLKNLCMTCHLWLDLFIPDTQEMFLGVACLQNMWWNCSFTYLITINHYYCYCDIHVWGCCVEIVVEIMTVASLVTWQPLHVIGSAIKANGKRR